MTSEPGGAASRNRRTACITTDWALIIASLHGSRGQDSTMDWAAAVDLHHDFHGALRRRGELGELALEGAAVKAQLPGGLGDVAAAIVQDPLNVLPFDQGERRAGFGRRVRIAAVIERRQDLVRVPAAR